jgi:hypothetical protein
MVIAKNYVQAFVIEKLNNMDKPVLSKQASRNVDIDKIDYERNAAYVNFRTLT